MPPRPISAMTLEHFHLTPVPHFSPPLHPRRSSDIHIFYHGNATDAYRSIGHLNPSRGMHMYIEYPGYAPHPTETPSSQNILEDVERLSRWIISNNKKVHIVGQSIGTGPACHLAFLLRNTPLVKKMDLVTPFSNMYQLAMDHVSLFGIFAWNCYPNDQCLEDVQRSGQLTKDKIIIHHGTDDEIIPYYHATTLSRYGTLKTYHGAEHNNIPWKLKHLEI